jgi:hypothetical protein
MIGQQRKKIIVALIASLIMATAAFPSPVSAAPKPVTFGAKLDGTIQPSNSFSPHACKETTGKGGACTRILMQAYHDPNTGQLAPKDGVVHKIKIVAGDSGWFIIEIAQVKPASIKNDTGNARIVAKGRKITYQGQGGVDNGGPYRVETFNVHIAVKKGEYLAIYSNSTSFERCSGGGANQLMYQPALQMSTKFTKAPYHDGCFLLLEAQY